MKGKTHLMIGTAAGITLGVNYPLETAIVIIASSVVGSLLPDIDHPKSSFNQKILFIKNKLYKTLIYSSIGTAITYYGSSIDDKLLILLGITLILTGITNHRGFTHSLLGLFLYTYIIKKITIRYDIQGVYIGFVAGYISHLIADFLTKGGIELFYPFKINISSPIKIKSGGFWERFIIKGTSIYSVYILWNHMKIGS
ncbi:MAG: metal-dependent hydrolase [Firmicutes bacterium]|nr:metal-dependent hydrolase [Bacillota bacterium]